MLIAMRMYQLSALSVKRRPALSPFCCDTLVVADDVFFPRLFAKKSIFSLPRFELVLYGFVVDDTLHKLRAILFFDGK